MSGQIPARRTLDRLQDELNRKSVQVPKTKPVPRIFDQTSHGRSNFVTAAIGAVQVSFAWVHLGIQQVLKPLELSIFLKLDARPWLRHLRTSQMHTERGLAGICKPK